MTTETDAEFVERLASDHNGPIYEAEMARLFALARRGAAMQWRPIETAPKEKGKYLLGWNRHHSGVIQYWPRAYEDDPEWVDESTEFIEPPVTHWMPLPPPPAGEQYHE